MRVIFGRVRYLVPRSHQYQEDECKQHCNVHRDVALEAPVVPSGVLSFEDETRVRDSLRTNGVRPIIAI